jgi:hypothetical protein
MPTGIINSRGPVQLRNVGFHYQNRGNVFGSVCVWPWT